jgi:hypothetical protein
MLHRTITLNVAMDAMEECLSYPIRTRQVVEADQRAAESEERLVDLVVAFVADRQTAVAVEPRKRALDHPAVAAKPLLGLDPLAGDPDLDPSAGERPAAAGDIVCLRRAS